MTWIKTVNEPDADAALKEIYKRIRSTRGKVSNIMRIQSLNPAVMEAHLNFYLSIMFKSSNLKREEREMIAVVVSRANGCSYCINHHAEALNFYWKDRQRVQNFIEDYRNIALPSSSRKMLDYAVQLTRYPDSIRESDIGQLRSAGFKDRAILDITLITGYFNFVNRLANGLGVEFSSDEMAGYQY